MEINVPVPDPDDPIWTAANGFVVRQDEGPLKLLNGGVEQARVKMSGDRTDGRMSLLEMYVAPGFGNFAHAHGQEDEAFHGNGHAAGLLHAVGPRTVLPRPW